MENVWSLLPTKGKIMLYMSMLKPTRLQSKQILVTFLNYLNQNLWNFWKGLFFSGALGGCGQRVRASRCGDLLTAFVPFPSPPTAPLSKHHHHKIFSHALYWGWRCCPRSPTSSRGAALLQVALPRQGTRVPWGVQRAAASAWETLLVTSTPRPAMPAGKPGVSKSCSWAHMSLWQREVLRAVVVGRQQI